MQPLNNETVVRMIWTVYIVDIPKVSFPAYRKLLARTDTHTHTEGRMQLHKSNWNAWVCLLSTSNRNLYDECLLRCVKQKCILSFLYVNQHTVTFVCQQQRAHLHELTVWIEFCNYMTIHKCILCKHRSRVWSVALQGYCKVSSRTFFRPARFQWDSL